MAATAALTETQTLPSSKSQFASHFASHFALNLIDTQVRRVGSDGFTSWKEGPTAC